MQEKILALLREAKKPVTQETLMKELKDKAAMEAAVQQLLNEHKVLLTRKRRLALPEHAGLTLGRIQAHARGYGFFKPQDNGVDAFVPADAMHGAMHGDTVWVRMTEQLSRNGSPEAEVSFIATRAYTQIVGTFTKEGRAGGYVVPDDVRIPFDVLIPGDHTGKAKSGDKVVANILEYPDGRRPMVGDIVEVLGGKNDIGTDVLSIIRQFQLKETFSKGATQTARQLNKPVSADDMVTREDLTGKCVFTIDGADAKDLDDAISLELLKNGNYYLGVHIADVSHYVKEGSALDREALERGTSVYFVDRVLPMLPPELSNGICSLHPGVERLTLSCFMEIDASGRVVRHRLSETTINSSYRLVYDDVSKLLAGDAALNKQYAALAPTLQDLEKLTLLLNARRIKRGSIDFDLAEANIALDEKGHAIGIHRAERGIANRMIEECMLLANETVAEHMYDLRSPFLYRVHEKPDKEKLSDLNAFLQTLGYSIRNVRDIQPRALQRVLLNARGTKEENIISKVVLRAMQKARYSETCLGHFGLASTRYCHFTSPTRRYPDLIGHRIIKQMLHGELNEKQANKLNERLPAIAEQTSRTERNAMEAERAVADLKKCEYMKGRVGEEFEGVISGVVSFGFFAELRNTVEGLVRVSALEDDYYVCEEKLHRFVGRNHGKVFRLGDAVQVRVTAVNMDSRNIDFELVAVE
ncbi:ribonuclease R [Christensenellaceae bacterium OttesenSCG-928-L17]|nr:ribonuclease R [Christensenellaceae bacterium OttesenSCG-928-L17]